MDWARGLSAYFAVVFRYFCLARSGPAAMAGSLTQGRATCKQRRIYRGSEKDVSLKRIRNNGRYPEAEGGSWKQASHPPFYYLLNHDVKINGCGDLGRGTQTTRDTDRHRLTAIDIERHCRLTITNTLLHAKTRKDILTWTDNQRSVWRSVEKGQTHPLLR